MTCEDVERVLPELLDAAEGAFPSGFEAHVQSCPACSDLLSDLKLLASEARQLAATEEPAPRVWVRIAAELRAEGLVHDQPETAPSRPVLVPTPARRRRTSTAWWLAPVAAGLIVAGSYVVSHKPAPTVAQQPPAASVKAPASVQSPAPETAKIRPNPVPTPARQQLANQQFSNQQLANQQLAKKATTPSGIPKPPLEPAASAEDQQFLSVVSTLAPSMRASYESELQAVNADIQETQAYVNRNPGDMDARQHLMDAYHQKALLYQIALDRIQ